MDWHELLPNLSVLMLAGAAFAFYVASRLGVWALQSRIDPAGQQDVGPATLAQWLPVATVATLALRDAPEVSVSIIFASSVACLTLVPGTSFFAAPPVEALDSRHRRAWGMLLPAAVLTLLAGFAAQFTLMHAAVMALQGIAALTLWMTSAPRELPTNPHPSAPQVSPSVGAGFRLLALAVWLALTFIGACVAMRAANRMTHEVNRLTGAMIAAVMIAPAAALPMIGSSLDWARQGRTGSAVSCATFTTRTSARSWAVAARGPAGSFPSPRRDSSRFARSRTSRSRRAR